MAQYPSQPSFFVKSFSVEWGLGGLSFKKLHQHGTGSDQREGGVSAFLGHRPVKYENISPTSLNRAVVDGAVSGLPIPFGSDGPSASYYGLPTASTYEYARALSLFSNRGQGPILTFRAAFYSKACMCAQSLQSCLTLCDPVNCSLPGFSGHGILQARTLEWVAIS